MIHNNIEIQLCYIWQNMCYEYIIYLLSFRQKYEKDIVWYIFVVSCCGFQPTDNTKLRSHNRCLLVEFLSYIIHLFIIQSENVCAYSAVKIWCNSDLNNKLKICPNKIFDIQLILQLVRLNILILAYFHNL